MAVTVKFEEKRRAAGEAQIPDLADYAVPEDRSEGIKAFWLWLLLIVPLGVGLATMEYTRGFGVGILLWWLASSFGYFVIAPRIVLRRLRLHAPEWEVTAKKNPRLKTLLIKGAGLLGVAEPETFLLDEGVSQVRMLGRKDPHFLIITQEACDLLAAPELDALVLRSLVHARQGHVSRLMLLKFVGDTPAAARILVWPVVLYAFLLRLNWQEAAQKTADRLALLLVKNHKILLGALLKQHAATDPIMQQLNVTPQDVDNFLRQDGAIGIAGAEISTQYKMGSAIQENPYLEERIQDLMRWAKSSEFQDAVKKLSPSHTTKTSPEPAVKTGAPRPAFDPLTDEPKQ